MKTKTLKGTLENAYGQKLKEPVDYIGPVDLFTTPDEVKEAKEWPTDSDIVTFVNQNRVANERQKLMQKALDDAGIKKPVADATPEGVQVAMRNIIKQYIATGKTEQEAIALTEGAFGVKLSQ